MAEARELGLDNRGPDGLPEVPGVVPKHGRCLRTEAEVPKTILEAGNLPKTAKWLGEVAPLVEVVAESSPEIAAVGPQEVQACVGDGGLAKSS